MSGFAERFGTAVGASARSLKPSALQVLRTLAQAAGFAVIEVLAMGHLDGWLWWAMLAVVARNAYVLMIVLIALSVVSADALKDNQAGESDS